MIANTLRRLSRPTLVLIVATTCVACNDKQAEGPAPPQTAEPAPAPKVTVTEDRGQQKSAEAADPAADQSAFSHVDSGEAERAASQRGHESAGETAPAKE